MAERIASGEVFVGLNDEEVSRGLAKVDQEFHRTMERINREKAVAHIEADLSELEDSVAIARREIKRLDGERAEINLGIRKGDVAKVESELAEAKAVLKALDGQKATLEIDLKGAEKALAADAAMRRSVEQTSRAYQKAEGDRARVMQTAERAAIQRAKAEEQQRRQSTVGIAQETAKVAQLQKQYARLTDQLERVSKKRPIGREARAKVELDAAGVITKMEAIKAELNFLGSHPPIDIKADVNRKGIVNKFKGVIADLGAALGNKAAGLGDLTLRLGPFTSSIKGAITALGFLGPTITDILGAAGALVGVLGAGIAGAATVGAGALTGMATAGLGFKFALRNTGQELAQARTSINAYQSAVLKYGATADKTKAKQKEMNSVLRQISPLAREAALGTENFYKKWDEGTKKTQANLGVVAKQGFQALDAIRPIMERQTNALSGMLAKAATGVNAFFRQGEGKNLLGGIVDNFDKAVPALLHGLGSIGHAFLNLASEGSKYLSQLTGGFDKLGGKLLGFTQRDDFGATVKRWVTDARDLLRFFGALGRVVVHFFGAGSEAGDGFVKTMTNALNRWDKFIQSAAGHNKIADFFQNSVKGTQELYTALQPLVSLFALWAVGLEPAVRVITEMFSWVTKATAAVGKLVGLSNPLATLGSTLGALWAVGKMGAFVSMLARAVTLVKELGAVGTLKSILSGQFFGAMKGAGGGIASAGEAAAAEMRAGIISGGTAAAAEMRAALATGGGVGAAENAASGLLGPGGKPIRAAERAGVDVAETAAGGAAASKAATGFGALRTAVMGVGAAFGAESLAASALATGGLTLVAAGAAYGAYKLITMKSAAEKFTDAIHNSDKKTQAYGKVTHELLGTMNAAGTEMKNYKDSVGRVADLKQRLNKEEKSGGKDTAAYKQTLSELNQALSERESHYKNTQALSKQASQLQQRATSLDNDRVAAVGRLNDAAKKRYDDEQKFRAQGMRGAALRNALKDDDEALAKAEANVAAKTKEHDAAQRRAQLGQLNYQRGLAGLVPLAGRAATALVNLAKKAPNLAATISLKYADPKDAGAVASKAAAALKSGAPAKIVTKIIADSKDAEDAIRRLNAAKITDKRLKVVEEGGKEAIAMIERLSGKKLTTKQQHIVEKGGENAIRVLERLIGKRLPTKTQKIGESGSSNVIGRINAVIQKAAGIHDKSITISANDAASGKLQGIFGWLGRINSKTITLTTVESHRGKAIGRRPGDTKGTLIGEGARHEYVVDNKTGQGFKTPGPMLYPLKDSQYVIPTEPKYKKRGSDFFKEMANDLGIKAFRKGKKAKKKDPAASSSQRQQARGQARSKIKTKAKPRTYSSDNLVELDTVETRKREEDNFREVIQREASQLDAQEPTTFVKQIGQDPETGDALYAVDTDAITKWGNRLEAMAKRFDQLVAKIRATLSAVEAAIARIGDPYKDNNPIGTVIGHAQHNKHVLQGLIDHEERVKKNKKLSKATHQMAQERIKTYRGAQGDEDTTIHNATSDWKQMDSEKNDIGDDKRGRMSEALDTAAQYRDDKGGLSDKATAEATSSNPKADFTPPPTPETPLQAAQDAIPGFDAEAALAAIGQGLNGQPPRSLDAINADRVAADQNIINVAKGMLSDTNPANDQDALSAISSAAGDISSITNPNGAASGDATGANLATQSMSLSSARQDLYTSMGANFSLASTFGATANAGALRSPQFAFGPSGPQQAPGAANGNGIVFNQTFQQMPDPHTWSQGVKFELQAAL